MADAPGVGVDEAAGDGAADCVGSGDGEAIDAASRASTGVPVAKVHVGAAAAVLQAAATAATAATPRAAMAMVRTGPRSSG